jgi:membrane protein DedA with SNARE-associated domain
MKFFLFDCLAAFISVPALVLGSYFGGEYIDQVFKVAKNVQTALVILSVFVVIFVAIRIKRWMKQKIAHDIDISSEKT